MSPHHCFDSELKKLQEIPADAPASPHPGTDKQSMGHRVWSLQKLMSARTCPSAVIATEKILLSKSCTSSSCWQNLNYIQNPRSKGVWEMQSLSIYPLGSSRVGKIMRRGAKGCKVPAESVEGNGKNGCYLSYVLLHSKRLSSLKQHL